MANNATMKSNLDPLFTKQVQKLAERAQEQKERVKGVQVKWMMPEKEDWSGDMFQLQSMEGMFGKAGRGHGEKLADMAEDVLSDGNKPGMAGDIIAISTQADYMAMMERAFRCRHTMRRPRAWTHAAGRHKGQGKPQGAFKQGAMEYVSGILKMMSKNS